MKRGAETSVVLKKDTEAWCCSVVLKHGTETTLVLKENADTWC